MKKYIIVILNIQFFRIGKNLIGTDQINEKIAIYPGMLVPQEDIDVMLSDKLCNKDDLLN